jgi:UDP-N-acetylmuramate dehydrogenase
MPEQSARCPAPQPASDGPYAERLAAAREQLGRIAGLEVLVNEPMDRHTSLGVGGPIDLYVIPHTVDEVRRALAVAHSCGLPLLVTGRGTNLLVRDGGYRGMVLHLGENFSGVVRDGNRIVAQSGATLAEVCASATDAGLTGLEFAAGIPGSIGGAAAMNAGTQSGQMADVIAGIEVIDETGEVVQCERGSLEFGYRQSCLRNRQCVALSVTLELRPGDPARVRRLVLDGIAARCRRQPLSLGSAGSVFKRPPGDYAGRLLEAAGCKGLRIGGAVFSPKHANFIVNEGSATAEDVVALIEAARRRVHDAFGVWLEEEICTVGEPP